MGKKKNCNVMRINIYYIENENYCICIKLRTRLLYFLFRKFVHVMVNNFTVMRMIIFFIMVMIILFKISLCIYFLLLR